MPPPNTMQGPVKRLIVAGWAVAAIAAAAGTAPAQDRHHWTQQYGSRGKLLGGAVVGSVRDPSGIYYNPGALWFVEEPGITVSANAYGYFRIALDDVAGTGRGLVESDFTAIPSMLAGVFRAGKDDQYAIGWTVMTRHDADLRITGRGEGVVDIVVGNPGPEYFVGAVEYRAKARETWIGVSSSTRLFDDRVAIGLSHFLAVRSGLASTVLDAEAINNLAGGTSLSRDRQRVEYLEIGMVWKLGIAANLDPVRLGLTITTPGVHLRGQGELDFQQASFGVDLNGDSIPDPFNVNLADERVEARWQRAMSFALGGSVDIGAWRIHASLEYFAAVGGFSVVRGRSTPATPAQGGLVYGFGHSQSAALNVALAGELAFNAEIVGFASLRTDFSTGRQGADSVVTLAAWDLYHVTVGSTLKFKGATLALGLEITIGIGDLDQPVNYGNAGEPTRLFGTTSSGDVDFFALALIVAYTYDF